MKRPHITRVLGAPGPLSLRDVYLYFNLVPLISSLSGI